MRKLLTILLFLCASGFAQVNTGFFGVDFSVGNTPSTANAAWPPSFRVQRLRLWGTRTRWADFEPCAPVASTIDAELAKPQGNNHITWSCKTDSTRSSFDFFNIDDAIDKAAAQGIDLELTLGIAPQFAITGDDASCAYHSDYPWANCAPPNDVTDTTTVCTKIPVGMRFGQAGNCAWKEGIYGLGKHLKNTGRTIKFWSPWNEISLRDFWFPRCFTADSVSCKNMARMAADAYQILKALDSTWFIYTPSTTVASGGAGHNGDYMIAYLGTSITDQGLGTRPAQYADGMVHHCYTDTSGIETVAEDVTAIFTDFLAAKAADANMTGKPVRCDEGGWGHNAALKTPASGVNMTILTYTKSSSTVTITTNVAHGLTTGSDLFVEGTYPQTAAGYGCTTNGHKVAIAGTSGTTIKWTDCDSSALPTITFKGQIVTQDCIGGWTCIDPLSVNAEAFITRFYLIAAAKGYEGFDQYSLGDAGWGSMFNFFTGTQTAPLSVAYDNLQDWITGATVVASSLTANPRTINITRPGGYKAQIAWRDSGTAAYTVPVPYAPVSGQSRTYQKFDEQSGIDAQFTTTSSVTIGTLPIMFEAPAIIASGGTGNVWGGTGKTGGTEVIH